MRTLIGSTVAALLCVAAVTPAHAGFCNQDNCTLSLTQSNYVGSGNFGTVTLTLSGDTATVDVSLASGFRIITTGFPGAFGFADSLGGGLTIGDFETGGVATTLYSGSNSAPTPCTTSACKWDGFGHANDAAATSGPKRSKSLQEVSFTVTKSTLTDVRQLLQAFIPNGPGAAQPTYFVVDSCTWNAVKSSCVNTGLLGVNKVPEPGSLLLLATGLVALGILRRRKAI